VPFKPRIEQALAPIVKNHPARRHREEFQPSALEQSAGSTRGKPERTRKKARLAAKIQLDRYYNLSERALTKSSQNRPELPSAENAHAVRKESKRRDGRFKHSV